MSALTAAWQAALAAEQRAVFGYGTLGPRLAAPDEQQAVACSDAHEALRDATTQAIASAGLVPVPPSADYPDLYPTGAAAARAQAVRLEDGCAAEWRFLYLQAASTTGRLATTLRRTAQQALTASAVRAAQWRGTPTPFPGST